MGSKSRTRSKSTGDASIDEPLELCHVASLEENSRLT